ncbi:hypothetical protein IMG5_022500 [Ichthyophthirius multifiliis]|uniref:Transmembrane protein n=1 Tax=Ichthyophthirius multifiliis TaxID=5932 RepID=G0QKV1_ICHMU|nr:hypothetical protein IMG5_022500 [Ichthyophthirius multifiliis]EGR34151.1 hypothetical protein IMG5_022500 [Ichthyophthirius multifiliis]|eukprot:XP_004039455.1 hypothetical protein IMG5_022500 [Ichthyophthirius multifiliis]
MGADPRQTSKQIEVLFLAVAWISSMCCLIRTDFNFAFSLFGYYLWISRDDKANSMMLIIMNAVLILVDIIWLLAVSSVWTTQTNNDAWNSLRGLHIFALIFSVVNVIIKIIITILINSYRSTQNNDYVSNIQGQNPQLGGYSIVQH